MEVRGMVTCCVCGRDFPLLAEDRYTARGNEKSGVIPALRGEKESNWFDAFDCPHCGCQNRVQERMRPLTEDFDFEDLKVGEEDDE